MMHTDTADEDRTSWTKNETVIASLKGAGFQNIVLGVIPKAFLCDDGVQRIQLVFSRAYFDDLALLTLRVLMQDTIIPALKAHKGKKVYVAANGITIVPQT